MPARRPGATMSPNIFLGANPFGPSADYIATFTGWFSVPTAAQYTFATASTDASFLEVDNRPVATWLGVHGAGPARMANTAEPLPWPPACTV